MTINESDRFELHVGLEKFLGDKLTNTLMDHLPPSGWSDVARKSDIDHLEKITDIRFQSYEARLEGIEGRLTRIDGTLKIIIGTGVAFGLALLALQVQIMLSIANL